MKHLCCSKIIFVLMFATSLFASLHDKSAVMYMGRNISYPMVGIHDYIFVNSKNTNTFMHGFDVYKKKIYPRVYVKGNYKHRVKLLLKQGYQNIYFVLDAQIRKKSFRRYIEMLMAQHPNIKIAMSGPLKILEKFRYKLQAIVLYNALSKKQNIKRFLNEGVDVIDVEFVQKDEIDLKASLPQKIQRKGMIPYITTKALDIYGKSSKEAIKREVLTIIDEDNVDRIISSAHQYGAMPLEYMGYIQHLHNLSKPLPDVDKVVREYAGVVVWLSAEAKDFHALFGWLLDLMKKGVKISFASNFGFTADGLLLNQFGIETSDSDEGVVNTKTVSYADKMMNFEIEPQVNDSTLYLRPKNPKKALLTFKDINGGVSTPAAIMPWGGYCVFGSFLYELDDNNLWVVNPFEYFKESLSLESIPVPDVTTDTGKRLMFTHIDGDGIMNVYESDPQKVSGDLIYAKILKKYKIPHSVSIIGAEVAPNGLYPELSARLMEIARKFYALENVEPATHTFTHPFKWGKIKHNALSPEYRLKPKGYHFSLYNELQAPLDFIQHKLMAKNNKKKAQTVFWSGDCAPRENALSFIYKHKLLNINGGYTTISNTEPWLTLVSPLGIERGGYYQIYTGAQNENVYTNDWLGPFWGFKKVVQTFKMTESPRRLKPIDVYYHLYSGSKLASLNALAYIFNWCLKQDVKPIYTSEYIPKVMDFYTVSMAKEKNSYLIAGLHNLKTIRFDTKRYSNMKKSRNILGQKQKKNVTYVHIGNKDKANLFMQQKPSKGVYLLAANGDVKDFHKGKGAYRYVIQSHVDLEVSFHIKKSCRIHSKPAASHQLFSHGRTQVTLEYKHHKEAQIDVICR